VQPTRPTTRPEAPGAPQERASADTPSRRSVMAVCAFATLGATGLAACSSSSSPTTTSSPAGSASTSAGSASTSGGSAQAALAKLADVPVGGAVAATAASGPIIIYRTSETAVIAHTAICTHQGTTVGVNGTELVCPKHGSRFNASTGAVLNGPAIAPLAEVKVTIDGANIVAG
jgi:cytochrome b6-f complex iron-sulfur subunit